MAANGGDFLDRVHDAATNASRKQLQSVNIAVELHHKGRVSTRAVPGTGNASGGEGDASEAAMETLRADMAGLKAEVGAMRHVLDRLATALLPSYEGSLHSPGLDSHAASVNASFKGGGGGSPSSFRDSSRDGAQAVPEWASAPDPPSAAPPAAKSAS